MSFLTSFVTGFATQAQKDIEERDKELRDEATMRWNNLLKEREKSKLRAEKRGEEIDNLARQMKAYGITDENQIVAALSSGTAPEIVESLSKMKEKLTSERAAQLIKVAPDQEIPSLATFRERATTLQPGAMSKPSDEQMTGAFGLRTRAFEQGLKSASAQTGVSMEDIYKTKLNDIPTINAIVDLTALAREKDTTFDAEQSRAKLNLAIAYASGDAESIQKAEDRMKVFTQVTEFGKPPKEQKAVTPQDTINELVSASHALTLKASELRSAGTQEDVTNAAQLDKFAKQYTDQAKKLYDSIPRKADKEEGGDPFKNLSTFRSDLRNIFSTATEAAQTRIGGSGFVPSVNAITGERTLTYTGTDPKAWETIYNERKKLIEEYMGTVVKQAGAVPPAMIVAASGMGVEVDKSGKVNVKRLGKEAGNVPEPAPAQPPKPSGVAAARSGGTQAKTIVRTGTIQSGPDKGKKVIEYSDGTREIQ